MHPADWKKLESATLKILTDAQAMQKRIVIVNASDFFESCRFAFLKRKDFRCSVDDYLATTAFRKEELGQWLYVNYENEYDLFVNLMPHDTDIKRPWLQSLIDSPDVVMQGFSKVKLPEPDPSFHIKFASGEEETIHGYVNLSEALEAIENEPRFAKYGSVVSINLIER